MASPQSLQSAVQQSSPLQPRQPARSIRQVQPVPTPEATPEQATSSAAGQPGKQVWHVLPISVCLGICVIAVRLLQIQITVWCAGLD